MQEARGETRSGERSSLCSSVVHTDDGGCAEGTGEAMANAGPPIDRYLAYLTPFGQPVSFGSRGVIGVN